MNNRLVNVLEIIKKQKLDAILISSVPNIIYVTNFSHFSTDEREAFVLITKSKQYIITDGRYSEAVARDVPHFELIERVQGTTLDKIFKKLKKKHNIKRLGIEENDLKVSEYKRLSTYFHKLIPCSITPLRVVKDEREIVAIEKACGLGDEAFTYILKRIKLGVTEKEVARELEFFIKQHGAEPSFRTIIAFGANASIPHHVVSDKKLKAGDFVLLDLGAKLNNYCSDMTRTVFFGQPTAEQKKMYQTVLEAQTRAIDVLRPRIPGSKPDKVARDFIVRQGFQTIPHSLGHGTGIEIHEAPRLGPTSKDVLKPGMVFSIEPGIYKPGFGGVRIEDLVVLEKNGPRFLTHSKRELVTLPFT